MKNRFKPKSNIKKGDEVVVITGNYKNLTAPKRVIAVYPTQKTVLVEGVNKVSVHKKPDAQNPQGGIITKEAPIHISNVLLWDKSEQAGTRIRREKKDGKTIRISKKSGEEIK